MADLIDRGKLFQDLREHNIPFNAYVNEALIVAPTVDAVPVVRCKDCKWYYQLWIDRGIMIEHCYHIRGVIVKADGYCAWGKRREDD